MPEELQDESDSALIAELKRIGRNCSLGKYRHFNAATRIQRLNSALDIASLAISLLLGSGFFYAASQELPLIFKWCGGALGFLGALFAALKIGYHFDAQWRAHRSIGNEYLQVEKRVSVTLSEHQDGLLRVTAISRRLHTLSEQYLSVARQSEPLPTGLSDYLYSRSKRTTSQGGGDGV